MLADTTQYRGLGWLPAFHYLDSPLKILGRLPSSRDRKNHPCCRAWAWRAPLPTIPSWLWIVLNEFYRLTMRFLVQGVFAAHGTEPCTLLHHKSSRCRVCGRFPANALRAELSRSVPGGFRQRYAEDQVVVSGVNANQSIKTFDAAHFTKA